MLKRLWQKVKSLFAQPEVEKKESRQPKQDVPVTAQHRDKQDMMKWAVLSYNLREEAMQRREKQREFEAQVAAWRDNIKQLDRIRQRLQQSN